jgi:adenylate cyclase
VNRRLAAILFYDVVGFSRAMEEAETATIKTLKDNYNFIIEPLVQRHQGRMIKVMGDGGFMEFASAVDAVHFSVSMQSALVLANQNLPAHRQLTYRIGINIGDVVADGNDLLGDGVNIASRLEGLAEPGGICVHQSVRDQVRSKLAIDFQDLGKTKLKNIDKPVQAYSILLNEKAKLLSQAPIHDDTRTGLTSTVRRIVFGVAACLMILLGVGLWQPWFQT